LSKNDGKSIATLCDKLLSTKQSTSMENKVETRNSFFNFRLTPTEMDTLRRASKAFGYLSFAEFIRTAIRDLIRKEKEQKNAE
jgi:hypothetical protein